MFLTFLIGTLLFAVFFSIVAYFKEKEDDKRSHYASVADILWMIGAVTFYSYFCDGYPVNFDRDNHRGEIYTVISQQPIEDGKFVVFAKEEDGDFRLFQFDAKVPEPGFIVTKVNGETKLVPHTPELASPQPQPAGNAVSYQWQKDGQPLPEAQPLTDNPPTTKP